MAAVFAAFMLPAPAAHASCAPGIVLGGGYYFATSAAVKAGAPLSGGYMPGCNDTVAIDPSTGARLSPIASPTPVTLNRIAGLPVRVGVAYNGRAALAAGYLPEVAGGPLHSRFSTKAPASCGRPWTLRGTVQAPPLPGSPVSLDGGRFLTLTGATSVTGLTRDGFPYLGAGDTLNATVRSCGSALVATRLTRAA